METFGLVQGGITMSEYEQLHTENEVIGTCPFEKLIRLISVYLGAEKDFVVTKTVGFYSYKL